MAQTTAQSQMCLLSGVRDPRVLGRDHEEAKVHRVFIGFGEPIPPHRVQR